MSFIPLQEGKVIANRYQIVRVIGIGGMSTVYLADDLKVTGKQWAIKQSLQYAYRPELFHQEASILAKMSHPFLPKIADFIEPDQDGYSYIIMEYIFGESLQSRFDRLGRLEWREVIGYALQICELFDYLHHFEPSPIIYRDLKPSNVLIDHTGHIRLVDFGIARHYSMQGKMDTIQLGTIGFAAPEQFLKMQSDERTDIYTIGALIYYLLSEGKFLGQIPRVPLRNHSPSLPEDLFSVVNKMTEHDPSDRYQSVMDVHNNLGKLLADRQQVEEKPLVAKTRKLVIVGGLFSGAGSTFISIGLARYLHRIGSSNAVFEAGCNSPELLALLNLGKVETQSRKFYEKNRNSLYCSWQDGYTQWNGLHSSMEKGCWKLETAFRAIFSTDAEVLLIDISTYWEDTVVKELLLMASEIIVVVSPNISKNLLQETLNRWKFLNHLKNNGQNVRIVINRDVKFRGRDEWIHSLPARPDAFSLELSSRNVLDAHWKGISPVDDDALFEEWSPGIKELIKILTLNAKLDTMQKKKRRSWFGKKI